MKAESLKQNKKAKSNSKSIEDIKQININDKIFDFDANLNIKEDKNNNSIFIYHNENKLINLKYFEEAESFKIELKTVLNAELITPNLNISNNYQYNFNFSKIPLADKDYNEFRHIILKINEIYLIITINFSSHYNLQKINAENINLLLYFENNNKLSFNFSIEDKLNKHHKKTAIKSKLPVWLNNIGIVYDNNKLKDKEFFFTDLKMKFKLNEMNILIRNYRQKDSSIYKNDFDKLDTLIEKLKFNGIKFFLEYDNTVPEPDSDNFSIMKLRSGESIKENNRNYIDFFNDAGKNNLNDIYQKIINLNSNGINLKPANALFTDVNIYEKSLCKTGTQMILYKKNIKSSLMILNNIIKIIRKKHDDFIFYSNILSDSLNETVFLKTVYKDNLFESLLIIEDYFAQGFSNFGFIITEKSINFLNTNLKLFIILLFSPVVFFDYELADKIETNQNILKVLNDIINLRINLRIYSERTFDLFKKEGYIPFKLFKEEDDILGFYYGEFLYCSLLHERLFDPFYAIPEGNWYSISDKITVKGLCNYVNREDKTPYKLFIKENSILLLLTQNPLNNYYSPEKLIFYIYPDFVNKKKLSVIYVENIAKAEKTNNLLHKINLSYHDKELIINYTNDGNLNTGRKFSFHIVNNSVIINKILVNNDKIIYKKDENYIEFDVIISKNSLNISIFY